MIALRGTRGQAKHICRWLTSQAESKQFQCRYSSMFAWKITDSLDNPSELGIRSKLKYMKTQMPIISSPSDVLVKIVSTSVNPLDLRMVYGYGRRVLDLLDIATNPEVRITNDRYPLTLGRDFSGEVVATGPLARHLRPGDLVFGAIDPQKSGSHAEYVTVPSYSLTKKPTNLSHDAAASTPFVALTAYSALCTFGSLSQGNCSGKQVLVIGGSGGVGSFAIQLLKLWGANVIATCSEDKIGWLEDELMVDRAVCHHDFSQMESLHGRFDFVLDCGAYEKTSFKRAEIVDNSLKYLKPYGQGVYVTLSPPILKNTDQHGLVLGTAGTAVEAICDTIRGLTNLNSARWAVYLPNRKALEYVASLYQDEAITPQVSSVFGFDLMPEAYEELESGRARGKVVVNVTKKGIISSQSERSAANSNKSADSAAT